VRLTPNSLPTEAYSSFVMDSPAAWRSATRLNIGPDHFSLRRAAYNCFPFSSGRARTSSHDLAS
jgi:hypothetical protein